MVDSSTIRIDGIIMLLERSKRAKHVSISIKPFKGVRVAIPVRVSFKKAIEFVHEKRDWIHRHIKSVERYESESEVIRDAFINIDATEAKAKLTRRLRQLAKRHGFLYNRLFIRNQKTRWGSCSHNNNISLNMKLVCLPDDLVDYVILHELVHTQKKNHGKGFWTTLDKYVGNAKDFASRLNRRRVYELQYHPD